MRKEIGKIVKVKRGNEKMGKKNMIKGIGNILRIVRVERIRNEGRNIEEREGECEDLENNNESRVIILKEIEDIREKGLLKESKKIVREENIESLEIEERKRRIEENKVRIFKKIIVGEV